MILILEAMCGVDCFCFHASQEIAAQYGCNRRQLQTVLSHMERADLIVRVFGENESDPDRLGIILRKRSDPSMAVADTDEALAKAIAELKQRRSRSEPTPLFKSPEGARSSAPHGARSTAPRGARSSAPIYKDQLDKDQRTTTTTKSGGSSLSSFSTSSPAEDSPPVRIDPPIPACPVPVPIDPRIEAKLGEHFPEPAERVEIEDRVHAWIASQTVERIIAVIVELAARRKLKARRNQPPIRDLAPYAESIMETWRTEGKVSMTAAKATGPPSARTADHVRVEHAAEDHAKAEKKRAETEASHRERVEEARLQALWDALSEAEKQAIDDRIKAHNPIVRQVKAMINPYRREAMKDRELSQPGTES